MNFLDRIDQLLEERHLNKNQLATHTGIPVSTVYGWYKKGYGSITLPTLLKLSEFFGCSMEYLVNGDPESEASPSSSALDIARKFDRLDEHSQAIVSALIDMELRRPALSMHEHFQAVYDSEYAAAIDDLLEAKQ